MSTSEQPKLGPPDFGVILKKAFTGGLAGAGAMVVQVSSLMWMRTIMNYQVSRRFTVEGTAITMEFAVSIWWINDTSHESAI